MKILGSRELAETLGVSKQLLSIWRKRGKLPTPIAELHCGPIWNKQDIDRWMNKNYGIGWIHPNKEHE